jgi:hypothetical protein
VRRCEGEDLITRRESKCSAPRVSIARTRRPAARGRDSVGHVDLGGEGDQNRLGAGVPTDAVCRQLRLRRRTRLRDTDPHLRCRVTLTGRMLIFSERHLRRVLPQSQDMPQFLIDLENGLAAWTAEPSVPASPERSEPGASTGRRTTCPPSTSSHLIRAARHIGRICGRLADSSC